jgi:RNA polymerase sigma factor (sigma-70 family)
VTTLPTAGERELLESLRHGDERAFSRLVDGYGAAMLRVARLYCRDRAVAEEVVQEAWLGVLRGIERFEGRSTLRTWLFRIVANVAKTRAVREARSVRSPRSQGSRTKGPRSTRTCSAVPTTSGRATGPRRRWTGSARTSGSSPPRPAP